MSAFVIFLIAHTGENSLAILAFVRLLTSVSAHVDHEISFLRECSSTIGPQALEKLET